MDPRVVASIAAVGAAIVAVGIIAVCYFCVYRKVCKRKKKYVEKNGYPTLPLLNPATKDIQIVQMLHRDQYSRYAELDKLHHPTPMDKQGGKNLLPDEGGERKRKDYIGLHRTRSPLHGYPEETRSLGATYFDEAINCTEHYYPQVDTPKSTRSLTTPLATRLQDDFHTPSSQPIERRSHRTKYSSKREKRSMSSIESPDSFRRPTLIKGRFQSEGNLSLPGSYDSNNAMRGPAISVVYPADGKVDFSLYYNPDNESLSIKMNKIVEIYVKPINYIGILEILRHDSNEKTRSKPYLKEDDNGHMELIHNGKVGYLVYVSLLPTKDFKDATNVVFGSTNAIFNETFIANGYSLEELKSFQLCIHVLSQFGSNGDPIIIGEIIVPLQGLQACQALPFLMEMAPPDNELELMTRGGNKVMNLGELSVVISFNPMTHQLVTKIIQTTNLPKCTMTGYPNVSVKASLYYCNNRIQKQCTVIQKKQKEPIFNETFHFDICKTRIAECDLVFQIRHHGPVHRTIIGYVHVGSSAAGTGANHWRQLLDFSQFEKVSHRIVSNKPAGLL